MVDSEHKDRRQAALYPEPTLVVGVGRFGLAVVERLGDDWRWLSTSAAGDASLRNLRLLSVRSQPDYGDDRWSRTDSELARIALLAGDDDLPTLALHFTILRTLGLIRFRDGVYQFALPKDAGVVEKGKLHDTRRRRFFKWRSLDSDPLRAIERLHRLASRNAEVDLFLTPVVERVLHGQSPRVLLHVIARCRALFAGRDPSPWAWLHDFTPHPREAPDHQNLATVDVDSAWWSEDDRLELLKGVLPPPLTPTPRVYDDGSADLPGEESYSLMEMDFPPLRIPRVFWPCPGDLATPLLPHRLLRVDWETSGWVADELDEAESVEFDPVEASLFRLGFFDHDGSSGFDHHRMAELLKEVGLALHRGLLRIWLDLQRERDENSPDERSRQRAGTDTAIEQCLELLGELIVQPVLQEPGFEPPERPTARADRWVDGAELDHEPPAPLKEAIVDMESPESMPERPLLKRLADLGLHFATDELGQRPLFRDITLAPHELDDDPRLIPLRQAINEETRHLVSFEHLKSYRKRPTRQPPRLSVFVVGDVKEPFTRRTLQPVLKALHQELIRAYGPIFDTSREGFDRALAITPIVWTPHPADAFGGDQPEANLIEEAAILESVHGLRRFIEALPSNQRCTPQLFINSRVTDSAVLSIDDAIAQTRDFLSLQIRNELGKDIWLRQSAAGFHANDLFSTFSCVQIQFPAERAREYLANRLARAALARLRSPGREGEADFDEEELIEVSPPPEDLLDPPRQRLRSKTRATADRLTSAVDDRLYVDASTTMNALRSSFDPEFEERLYREVHDAWITLTRNRGAMDSMVNDLRRSTAQHLETTVEQSRRGADRLIEDHAARGCLKSAQSGFRRLHDRSRTMLEESEALRRDSQDLCLRHKIPDPNPIARARNGVVTAAEQKPDRLPMLLGLVLWAAMAPVLGAPISHAVARAFDLQDSINPVEILLGPLGFVVGGLLIFFPAYLLLRSHMNKQVNAVRDAIRSLSDAVRDVVEGSDSGLFSSSPSIRSFISARLKLTAALAGRNFADRIHDRVARDNRLAFRLFQSIDVQQRRLRQRAEALGVRPRAIEEDAGAVDDDVRAIFDTGKRSTHSLLGPEHMVDFYRTHYPNDQDLDATIPELLASAGGFGRWREEAVLSDTERLLDYGREEFVDLVTTPVGAHGAFEDEVGRNLASFVATHYSNIGFGARFTGYEGFDADGLRRMADTSLLIHPQLHPAFEKARRAEESPPTTETLDIIEARILPNTAFVISLVQGIHARSVHNLRRFETFFDRLELPDPATPWHNGPLTVTGRRRSLPEPEPKPEPAPEPEPQAPETPREEP